MVAKKQQGGFTLVEIAIVLVIIGVLLGGALKGQELIQNSRINDLRADYQSYTAAMVAYQDRYNALPGDDNAANANHGGVNPQGNNAGNGVLNGNWNAAEGNESRLFWEHLRSAGFVTAGTGQDLPTHAFGGSVGVQVNAQGIVGLSVCFQNILGENARVLDAKYDDGLQNAGNIRGVNANGAADYNLAGNVGVFCMGME